MSNDSGDTPVLPVCHSLDNCYIAAKTKHGQEKILARALFVVGAFIPLPTPSLSNAPQSVRNPRGRQIPPPRTPQAVTRQGRRW